jgi:hypothetical protein
MGYFICYTQLKNGGCENPFHPCATDFFYQIVGSFQKYDYLCTRIFKKNGVIAVQNFSALCIIINVIVVLR